MRRGGSVPVGQWRKARGRSGATAVITIAANASAVQHFTFIAMVEPVIGQVKALLP
jgi:hypothetical protein